MKGLFLDAVDDLADVFRRVVRPDDPPVTVNEQLEVPPDTLPGLLAGYDFVLDDHSQMPTEVMRRCAGLRHIIFLGTGARSYMHPEELAEHGITVHIIKGYGDTAVAEHTIALMWPRRVASRSWTAACGAAYRSAPRAWSLPARRSDCSGSAASPPRWRASRRVPACG